jgi:hypothetical protein
MCILTHSIQHQLGKEQDNKYQVANANPGEKFFSEFIIVLRQIVVQKDGF